MRTAAIIAAPKDPVLSAFCGFEPGLAFTRKIPITEAKIPTTHKRSGSDTSLNFMEEEASTATPRIMQPTIDPTYDSKRSAPIPATSPTLSPTLSAITAGFLGSSSGIPASTFPTRSAPTSAAFVKIPPPTLAKSAIDDAPRENPDNIGRILSASISTEAPSDFVAEKSTMNIPRSASPTTLIPITDPPANDILSASVSPVSAAAVVVLALEAVATFIPM